MQALLPYELVQAVITSQALNRGLVVDGTDRRTVVTQFVRVAIDTYLDHEPHEVMTRVKVQRIWENVERAADSRRMTSYITTVFEGDFDWARFDGLKAYILEHLRRQRQQVATQVTENQLLLALLRASYCLLRFGFYSTDETTELVPVVLGVLDSAADRVGLHADEAHDERYKLRVDPGCNTMLVMECKVWACRVLSLVCTMRCDLRLSLLLKHYKHELLQGRYGALDRRDMGGVQPVFRGSLVGGLLHSVTSKEGSMGSTASASFVPTPSLVKSGYTRLTEDTEPFLRETPYEYSTMRESGMTRESGATRESGFRESGTLADDGGMLRDSDDETTRRALGFGSRALPSPPPSPPPAPADAAGALPTWLAAPPASAGCAPTSATSSSAPAGQPRQPQELPPTVPAAVEAGPKIAPSATMATPASAAKVAKTALTKGKTPPAATAAAAAAARARTRGRRRVHSGASRMVPGLFELLTLEVDPSGGSGADLMSILLDLTFYEHTELVEAALELLVRRGCLARPLTWPPIGLALALIPLWAFGLRLPYGF